MTIKNWLTKNNIPLINGINKYYEIKESQFIQLIEFIVKEQKQLCTDGFLNESETDIVLGAKEVKYEN